GEARPAADTQYLGLEDQRVGSIPLIDALDLRGRTNRPIAVLIRAEQRGKARVRIETRQTQPIDRAGARDERDGPRVADEPIVFDESSHEVHVTVAKFGTLSPQHCGADRSARSLPASDFAWVSRRERSRCVLTPSGGATKYS